MLKRYKSQRDAPVPKTREMMLHPRRGIKDIEERNQGKRKEGKNLLKPDTGKKMMIAIGGEGTIEIEMIEVSKEEIKRNGEDQHLADVLHHQRDVHLPTGKDQLKNKQKKSA